MSIETERLLLREFTISDVPALMETLSDPVAMQFYPCVLDEAGTIDWVERNIDRYNQYGIGLWAAINKETNKFVGQVGLIPQEINGRHEIEIGYLLSVDNWGKGYATEGATGCMNYALNILDKCKVVCTIRPENQPSIRVAQRLGMTIEGEFMMMGLKHLVFSRMKNEN